MGWFKLDNELPFAVARECGAAASVVFVYLNRRADANGRCWPSTELIASDCGMTKRHAIRAIKRLESSGYLAVVRRHGAANQYHLQSGDRIDPSSSGDQKRTSDKIDTPTGDKKRPKVVTKSTPEVLPKKVNPGEGIPTLGEPVEDPLKPESEEFLESWNALSGVRPARQISGKRLTAYKARIRAPDWPGDAARAMERFPLRCFGGDGWVPNIDWFLRPDTVTKILEGQYDWSKDRANGHTKSRSGPGQIHAADAAERSQIGIF